MWVKARKLMGQLNRTAVTSVNPQSSDIKNPRVLKEKCVTGTGGQENIYHVEPGALTVCFEYHRVRRFFLEF